MRVILWTTPSEFQQPANPVFPRGNLKKKLISQIITPTQIYGLPTFLSNTWKSLYWVEETDLCKGTDIHSVLFYSVVFSIFFLSTCPGSLS